MSDHAIISRIAEQADLPNLLELQSLSLLELSDGYYERELVQRFLDEKEMVTPELIAEGHYFVFVETGGQIVASGGWSQETPGYAKGAAELDAPTSQSEALVRSMFVRPDRVRRGLGRRMMTLIEDDARENGMVRLTLSATRMGKPLYAACGFRLVDEQTIGLSEGRTIQGFGMEKSLVAMPPNLAWENGGHLAC